MACSGIETADLFEAALGSTQYCARVFYGELFLNKAFSVKSAVYTYGLNPRYKKLAHEIKPKAHRTTPSYQRIICVCIS